VEGICEVYSLTVRGWTLPTSEYSHSSSLGKTPWKR
jgi:hypothetical protein